MARDEQLKERWEELVTKLSNQFADGDVLDLDARFDAHSHLQIIRTIWIL